MSGTGALLYIAGVAAAAAVPSLETECSKSFCENTRLRANFAIEPTFGFGHIDMRFYQRISSQWAFGETNRYRLHYIGYWSPWDNQALGVGAGLSQSEFWHGANGFSYGLYYEYWFSRSTPRLTLNLAVLHERLPSSSAVVFLAGINGRIMDF